MFKWLTRIGWHGPARPVRCCHASHVETEVEARVKRLAANNAAQDDLSDIKPPTTRRVRAGRHQYLSSIALNYELMLQDVNALEKFFKKVDKKI